LIGSPRGASWPNGLYVGFHIRKTEFEPWSGLLSRVLERDTLLSTQVYNWVTGEPSGGVNPMMDISILSSEREMGGGGWVEISLVPQEALSPRHLPGTNALQN